MARENSLSDSEGRSITPDLDEFDGDDGIESAAVANPTFSNGQAVGESLQASTTQTLNKNEGTIGKGLIYEEPSAMYSAPATVTLNGDGNGQSQSQTRQNTTTTHRPGAGLARFRASAHKIIQMRRSSGAMYNGKSNVGAEPGVDPRHSLAFYSYGHIRQKCTIEMVDYSSVRSSFGKMQNKGFVEFLTNATASKPESWVKVRWINIGGISWDVISALAIRYNIHPLALEDVLHRREQARSKADYYNQHLFIRILRHTLVTDADAEPHPTAPIMSDLPRSASPLDIEDPTDDEGRDDFGKRTGGSEDEGEMEAASARRRFALRRRNTKKNRMRAMSMVLPDGDLEIGPGPGPGPEKPVFSRLKTTSSMLSRRKQYASALTIEEIKREGRVQVRTIPMYLFLFRDGTVISISESTDISCTSPISSRLHQRDTSLRATADPSLLIQSLLDLIVDQALEVVDEYQKMILKVEHDVLVQPNMKQVRLLHVLSGDLTLHKRTLEPIKSLIYGLRRYDLDRCAALYGGGAHSVDPKTVKGYMTHKSKIYLADVHDHIDYILVSIDMFESITENLINYSFNMKSYEMNETMRRLTLATIIFLPLTLLTGYFGMNFTQMNSIERSELFFWQIALPLMAVLIPLFLANDILRAAHYVKKKFWEKRITKEMKSA